MNPELKDKFISNLVALPKMNSARFMAIDGVDRPATRAALHDMFHAEDAP